MSIFTDIVPETILKLIEKCLISVALLLLTAATSMAVPANQDLADVNQPDGSKITISFHGDEFQNWTELKETGHTVIRNHSTGFWEFAEQGTDGVLRGSGVAVRSRGQNAPAHIPKGLRPLRNKELEKQMSLMLQDVYQERVSGVSTVSSTDGSDAAPGDWLPAPVSGPRKMLVVLVGFANRGFATTPASWSTSVFDTAAKSVAKYYKENSLNALNIAPVAHTQPGNPAGVVSVTLTTNHPWYIGNTTSISYADDQAWGNSALLNVAPFVDFNALDTNGNGILEPSEVVIYFIVAGYEYSASSGLTPAVWAHAWRTSGAGLTAGTKNVQRWSQSGEYYNATTRMPMGVIAHELGHQMGGLPDLYDTSQTNSAMGEFSLMAAGSWGGDYIGSGLYETGGTTPTALDAWSREYLGWSVPVIPAAGTVSLPNALSVSNAPLKLILPSTSSTEYFLAENRYPTGWDLGLKRRLGSSWTGGMLLTHIDITAGSLGSNDINSYTANISTPGHQGVVPVQASTTSCNMLVGTACRGHATTLYYQGNYTVWGPSTSPNSNYYNGAGTALELSAISLPASTMTAFLNTNAPTNGKCGISYNQVFSAVPATGFCLSGAASIVSGIGPWFWSCSGLNGGTTASCMAYSTSQQGNLSPFPQNFDSVAALPAGWSSMGVKDPLYPAYTSSWQVRSGTLFPTPYTPPHQTTAHSPNNLVYFNSYDLSPGTTAYLTSPPFSLAGKVGGTVSLWMYHDTQYNDSDRIDVYVHTSPNLTGANLLGSAARYDGSNGWSLHTFNIPSSFTGATNYLHINGISGWGNNIHLDDINVYAYTPLYPLSFSFAGSGYGSLNSAPSGISCSGTAGSVCMPANFSAGSVVTLSASADSSSKDYSLFSGWTTSAIACPGTGTCSVTMNAPVNVTGNFALDKLVKITGQSSGSFGTIKEAYTNPASSGQTIEVRDNSTLEPFDDDLVINKAVTLKGGFDSGFATNNGYTITKGSITVGIGGVLKVQRIILR